MKFKYFKYVLIIILIVIAIAPIYLSYKIQDKSKRNLHLKTDSVSVDKNYLILQGVNFYNSKAGTLFWRLKANKAKIYKTKNLAYLDNVSIIFKKKGIKINSKHGIYNLKNKNATVYDYVVITGNMWKIFTDNVTFINDYDKILSNTPFRMIGDNFYIKGNQLTGFIDKKIFKIKGRVKSKWGAK